MANFRIGSAFGIPIKLDVTFLLILPVFAWLIASQIAVTITQLEAVFGVAIDGTTLTAGSTPLVLGTIAAIGLFAGVLLHELGHSVVAMRYGYPIDSITLWLLGGIAQLSEMPEDWKQELYIAVAGPAVSVAIGVGCYVGLLLLPVSLPAARFVVGYLALMNFALAAFNLLPGFPMDGGRVLRALLSRTRPFARATQIAARVGKAFAFLLALLGLFGGGIILILIAFFIYMGASGEAQRTVMNAAFENVAVRDVMTPVADVKHVSPDLSVSDLVDRMFRDRHTGYPVVDGGRLVGMVTLEDARGVEDVEREAFRVEDVMSTDLYTVSPDANAMEAFETMQQNGVGRLLVVDASGDLVGLLSRTDLMTALDIIKNTGPASGVPTMTRSAESGSDVARP
ncbi:MAG: CBS domain-containing protein [Halobacteriaceae archaeon]